MRSFIILIVFIGFFSSLSLEAKEHSKAHKKPIKKSTPQRILSEDEIAFNQELTSSFQAYTSASRTVAEDMVTCRAILKYISNRHQEISSEDAQRIAEEIVEQGKTFQIDPKFAAAIISAESGFNKTAQSKSGAKGLGQLMGSTYRQLGVTNPFDIEENIEATMHYLKDLVTMWDGHSLQLSYAVASYLRGPDLVVRSNGKFSKFTLQYLGLILKKYQAICSIEDHLKNEIALTY